MSYIDAIIGTMEAPAPKVSKLRDQTLNQARLETVGLCPQPELDTRGGLDGPDTSTPGPSSNFSNGNIVAAKTRAG